MAARCSSSVALRELLGCSNLPILPPGRSRFHPASDQTGPLRKSKRQLAHPTFTGTYPSHPPHPRAHITPGPRSCRAVLSLTTSSPPPLPELPKASSSSFQARRPPLTPARPRPLPLSTSHRTALPRGRCTWPCRREPRSRRPSRCQTRTTSSSVRCATTMALPVASAAPA